jgi:DNA-binding Lrp family transcriptional regulator
MSAIQQILEYLAANPEKEFTLQELARAVGKDTSNTGKRVRNLAKQGKLKYTAGVGTDSKVSYLPTYLPTHLPTGKPEIEETIQVEAKRKGREAALKTVGIDQELPVKPKRIRRATKLTFNKFMEKLEKSDSYASKHLKEKLFVRGKFKGVNKERVIRIIRDVLDIYHE